MELGLASTDTWYCGQDAMNDGWNYGLQSKVIYVGETYSWTVCKNLNVELRIILMQHVHEVSYPIDYLSKSKLTTEK